MKEVDNKPEFPLKKEDKKLYVKLADSQLDKKIEFIKNYISSSNAAEGSEVDPNANITNKNIHTLEYEINKDIITQVNRRLITDKLKELFDEEAANDYIRLLEEHYIYCHDETSLKPYCVSISMYPFLLEGLKCLDKNGCSAPKHLGSFCGGFINLMLAVASQFAGAVATCEFLMYFDYFAKKDFGDNYLETNYNIVEGSFSQVVYSINQPSVSRGYQSIFWNISIYDREYFNAIFGEFCFPDGTKPDYDSLDKLQKVFMKWFNNERTKSLLTYPVVTAACLHDNNDLKDQNFKNFITKELSKGNSFFIYTSNNASALSSCCFKGDEIIELECNKIKQRLPIKTFVDLVMKHMIDINKNEVFINSWNPIRNVFEKTRVVRVLRRKKYGKMYKISTKDSSITITGDHIVPMLNYHNKLETKTVEFYYNVLKKYEKDNTCYAAKPNYKVLTLNGWEDCRIELI